MGVRDWMRRLVFGKNAGVLVPVAPQLAPRERKADVFYTVVVGGSSLPSLSLQGYNLTRLLELATWSYACITANAEAAASLQWVVQRAGGEGEDKWVEDTSHPLNRLLKYPFGESTDLPKWSWQQLLETIFLHWYLVGNSYLRPKIESGRILFVELLLPTGMQVQTNLAGYPERYSYNGRLFEPSQIVHVMNASPDNLAEGEAPFAAAQDAITIDRTARDRQKATLENRIAPGLILQVEGGLREEQRLEFQEQVEADYQAATAEGTPWILGNKVTVVASPEQKVGYKETRLLARDEIIAIFGTFPPVIGVMDSATLQNFDRGVRIWWANELFPLLQSHANAINQQLVWPVYGDSVRLWYDLTGTEIALILLRERIAAAQDLVNIGYPPNMASAKVGLGMPYVPELDQPLQNQVIAGRESTEE